MHCSNTTEHHIIPLSVYFSVAVGLLVLTGVTVFVAKLDLGEWAIVIALLVAAIKASLVLLYFMHLRYDNRMYAIVFCGAVLFLAIFIGFTMIDTENRAAIYSERSVPIHAKAAIYPSSTWNGPIESGADFARATFDSLQQSDEYRFVDAITAYDDLCAVCHGTEGKGDGFNAFNLDPKPKSFSDSAVVSKFTDEYLYEVTAKGGEAVGLTASMPGYERNLTDKEIRRLIQYVRELAKVDSL